MNSGVILKFVFVFYTAEIMMYRGNYLVRRKKVEDTEVIGENGWRNVLSIKCT